MLTSPHEKGARVDKSSGSKKLDQAGIGMAVPLATYEGITYVQEKERLERPPMSQSPDGGCC